MVADSSLIIPDHELGSRVECCGYFGTIKYIGPVEGHPGVWLGIDWDDVSRGKHNGTVNGVEYFQTRYSKSGSFVRREKVNFGQSTVNSIISRYGVLEDVDMFEQLRLTFQQKTNAPFLEMVGFEKVARKQSEFYALQVVNLRLCNINSPGAPLELKNLFPNIRELDISKNLLCNWTDIFDICSQLDCLNILIVSENVLSIPENYDNYSFSQVKVLICGYMNLNWEDVKKITQVFDSVEELRLPFNNITVLETIATNNFTSLKNLDLEGNCISNWSEILKLSVASNLEEMNLVDIQLKSIAFEGSSEKVDVFNNLRKLNLNDNLINDWNSIGELNRLENLEELRLMKNPILETESIATRRQIITAKIAGLKVLNGSIIKAEDRRGAEYDYIKKYGLEWLSVQDTPNSEQFLNQHNRYLELIQKYGNPEESELKVQSNILISALITLNILFEDRQVKKKFPPSLLVQKLVMLIQKLFKLQERPTLLYKSTKSDIEIFLEDEMKEIGFYSIQDGDAIIVSVSQ